MALESAAGASDGWLDIMLSYELDLSENTDGTGDDGLLAARLKDNVREEVGSETDS